MRLGQHFLINKSVARKIVAALEIKSNEVVIEIGAGHGELTAYLNNESRIMNPAVKIIAIEKDPGLVNKLLSLKVNKFWDSVEILEGDARKIIPQIIKTYKLENLQTYKLVGNIPYHLTGYLLRLISELKQKPELCVFTVQKEVALRIAAQPPRMNKLAASVQFWAEPVIIGVISKKDFQPAPKVDSAIIKFVPQNKITTIISQLCLNYSKKDVNNVDIIENLQNSYYRTVNILFRQPRKTILNNVIEAKLCEIPNTNRESVRKNILEKLAEIGINPQDRPQNLSIEDIIKISASFHLDFINE